MGMKESEGSLRLYFILVGVVGGLSNYSALTRGGVGVLFLSIYVVGLLIAAGFLCAAVFLDKFLDRSARPLKLLLWITICASAARGLLVLAIRPVPIGFVYPIVAVLIGFYLLANVSRLAREREDVLIS